MQIDIYACKHKKWAVQKSQPPAVAVKCRKAHIVPNQNSFKKNLFIG